MGGSGTLILVWNFLAALRWLSIELKVRVGSVYWGKCAGWYSLNIDYLRRGSDEKYQFRYANIWNNQGNSNLTIGANVKIKNFVGFGWLVIINAI